MAVSDDGVHFPVSWSVAGIDIRRTLVDIDPVRDFAATGITGEPFAFAIFSTLAG